MVFNEAVEALISGKYVSRESWQKDDASYLCFLPGIGNFLKVTVQPKPNVVPWASDIDAATANDWIIVNNIEELKIASEQLATPVAA